MQLPYITGNIIKFNLGSGMLRDFGVQLEQVKLDIPEIQAEEGEPVARNKAMQAFELLQKPLVVSDDSWSIPGLKGFPGPYMKSMNTWFTPQDWLRLTKDLSDRRFILRQIVVYQDAQQQKLFSVDVEGVLLREVRGMSPYAHSSVLSFDGGKTSSAEAHERDKAESSVRDHHNAWQELGEWLQASGLAQATPQKP